MTAATKSEMVWTFVELTRMSASGRDPDEFAQHLVEHSEPSLVGTPVTDGVI